MNGVPAYGRDYKSKKAILEDWNEGKDFQSSDLFSRGYFNKGDMESKGIDSVSIRYKKLTQVAIIKRNSKGVWK